MPKAHPPCSPELRRQMVDLVRAGRSAEALRLVAEAFGPDRVLFGSDWPFSMGLIEPHAQLAGLEAALRGRILAAGPG